MSLDFLKSIASSASKLVLIIFALAIVVGLFAGKISEDTFKVAALMVFTFYFTLNSNPTPVSGSPSDK